MAATPGFAGGSNGMRVSRRFLYWGVFLLAVGLVLVASDLKAIDAPTLQAALGYWPLAIIALGLGIVARRSRLNAPAWVVAAAVPGLFLGSIGALAPQISLACGSPEPTPVVASEGAFAGPSTISVTTGCGVLSVGTATGSGWRLDAGSTDNVAPDVNATATSLTVRSGRTGGWFGLGGRDVWSLAVPTAPIDSLVLDVNAGQGTVNLAGAQVRTLGLRANAARVYADLSGASLGGLAATANAGALSVSLPGGDDLRATLEVTAGRIDVCVPPGLGVQVEQRTTLGSTSYRGATQGGPIWQSPDYGTAAHHADLVVHVDLGTVDIDPIGGCK